jgi:hypothetical protein
MLHRALVAAGLVLAVAQPAKAAAILDTGLTYNQGQGLGVSRVNSFAAKFALAEATTITSLEFALFVYDNNNPDPMLLDYKIYNADLGLPDASQPLFSTTISAGPTPPVAFTSENFGPRTIGIGPTGLSLDLGAGRYWLALSSPTSGSVRASLGRTVNVSSADFILNGPGNLNAPTWFVGLTNLGTFGVRIQGDPTGTGGGVGSVPEPDSWAMLIAGFGCTGAVMRRRRGFVSVAA